MPVITTGKLCKDEESGDHFVCLGFADTSQSHIHESPISMVARQGAKCIGVVLNKDQVASQTQKSFNLINVKPLSDAQPFALNGNLTRD